MTPASSPNANEFFNSRLKLCFEGSAHPEEVKDALRYFTRGYATCAENRNILMHSQAIPLIDTTTNTNGLPF
jgi:hypothetical protein